MELKTSVLYVCVWFGMLLGSCLLLPLTIILWIANIALWVLLLLLRPITCLGSNCKSKDIWPIEFPNSDLLYVQAPSFLVYGILLICSFPVWILISGFVKLSDWFYVHYYKHRNESYTSNSCWIPFKEMWAESMPILDTSVKYTSKAEKSREIVSRECDVCKLHIVSERHIMILNPCGHGCCNECASQLRTCHICRKNIISRIRLFYEV